MGNVGGATTKHRGEECVRRDLRVSPSHTEYILFIYNPYRCLHPRREEKHKHKNVDMAALVHGNDNDKCEGTKTINTNLRAASPRK